MTDRSVRKDIMDAIAEAAPYGAGAAAFAIARKRVLKRAQRMMRKSTPIDARDAKFGKKIPGIVANSAAGVAALPAIGTGTFARDWYRNANRENK